MKLELEFFRCFCAAKVFEINGIRAFSYDFGDQADIDKENAGGYCCGNMQFIPKPPTKEILEKYGITEEECQEIAQLLKEGLSFGCCRMCF